MSEVSIACTLARKIRPFQIEETGFQDNLAGSATITETILTSVPEPSTWAMALIGFAIVGFAAHSRRLARPPRRVV
jgi:PEP-CTERM motif